MAKPATAGKLRERIHFQQREEYDDGYGNKESSFVTRFTRSAQYSPLRGGENVMSSRLTGRQPYIVTVRQDDQTRQVEVDWRIVDARYPKKEMNIHAITDPDGRRQWLEILATDGEAT